MGKSTDDLEAVRILVDTLQPFDAKDQERIIRWAREKLGLPVSEQNLPQGQGEEQRRLSDKKETVDIKSFVSKKNPSSDNHFAAVVAYYYRFDAPEEQKKDSITSKDLQDACRLVDRDRLDNPAQTLVNAHNAGLLDRKEHGAYSINTVGENLVAMTLPSGPQAKELKKQRKKTRSKKFMKKHSRRKA
jgi:hypothetical protein